MTQSNIYLSADREIVNIVMMLGIQASNELGVGQQWASKMEELMVTIPWSSDEQKASNENEVRKWLWSIQSMFDPRFLSEPILDRLNGEYSNETVSMFPNIPE